MYISYDFDLIGPHWANFLATENYLLMLVLGVVAVTTLCAYLIRKRDKACSAAFAEHSFTSIEEAQFVSQYQPGNFKRLSKRVTVDAEHNNYYSGTLLDRTVLLFNRSYYGHNLAGKAAAIKSTFAMLTLDVDVPNFKLSNASIAKNIAMSTAAPKAVDLNPSLKMQAFIIQGQNNALIQKVFNDELCQHLYGNDYIEIECIDNKLLINHYATRIYTAKGVRQFIELIGNIITALESNDDFHQRKVLNKAA